jgi:nucleotide-binding universal stress UspA family protein
MIRDLIVPMTGAAGAENALASAIALAEAQNAHLCVIEPVDLPTPMTNPWGLPSEIAMAGTYETLREDGKANAEKLRVRLAKESISWEVRVVESLFVEPPRSLAMQARHADLSVIAAAIQGNAAEAALVDAYFNGLLFESGRPVLVVPPERSMAFPVSHAVIAWQPTREATRALHDALPLLRAATTVDVVMVDPVAGDSRDSRQPVVDIAGHLARHGLQVNVVTQARHKETVATVLLRHAAESGAQLLVAGGYGHTRLREWALGGTTRELSQAASTPILFSH